MISVQTYCPREATGGGLGNARAPHSAHWPATGRLPHGRAGGGRDARDLSWHNTPEPNPRKLSLVDLSDIIDRVDAMSSMLAESEEPRARRVVAIARQLCEADTVHDDAGVTDEAALRRELNQHFELLGRRGARALPAAALARALLARLGGTQRDVDEALNDCNQKLWMFGL